MRGGSSTSFAASGQGIDTPVGGGVCRDHRDAGAGCCSLIQDVGAGGVGGKGAVGRNAGFVFFFLKRLIFFGCWPRFRLF